jgi:hypothetical protein
MQRKRFTAEFKRERFGKDLSGALVGAIAFDTVKVK